MLPTDCLFCKIVSGKIPCYKVYEDATVFAFLDIHPHAKGHAVVIPKIHAVTIFDLEEKQMQPLMLAVKKTMGLLQKKLQPDGFNVGWNSGAAGGQVVPHLHIHILPRYNGDGGGSIHSIIKNPREKDVEEVAKLFR